MLKFYEKYCKLFLYIIIYAYTNKWYICFNFIIIVSTLLIRVNREFWYFGCKNENSISILKNINVKNSKSMDCITKNKLVIRILKIHRIFRVVEQA